MFWTKKVKEVATLIFLVLLAVCAVDFIIDVIRYHNFFNYLLSFVRSVISYGLTLATLLVVTEISENVYDIKMGNKTPASFSAPAKPAAPAAPAAPAKAEEETKTDAE